MIGELAIAAAAVALLVAGVVALQPSEFRIARTATIAAPASAVFAQVNDFHKWEAWSPWARRDPAMRKNRMVGGEFETGLAQLKSVVEAAPRAGALPAGDGS